MRTTRASGAGMLVGMARARHDGDVGGGGVASRALRRRESCADGIEIGELGRQIAAAAIDQADGLIGPIETLHYCSHTVHLWEGGRSVLGRETADAIGYGVVTRLAEVEDARAPTLLRGIAAVADDPIGIVAANALASGSTPGTPGWLRAVGSPAIVRAGRVEDPTSDEGTIVLFDLLWPCGERGGLGVFIDNARCATAKHILVGPTIDECLEEIEDAEGSPWRLEELDPAAAGGLVRQAVDRTESDPGAPVGPTYPSQRAFLRVVLRRIEAAGGSAEPRNSEP